MEVVKNQDGDPTELMQSRVNHASKISVEELQSRRAELEALEKVKDKDAILVTSKYWEAREDDKIKGKFMGMRTLTKNDPESEDGVKLLPAVVLQTLQGEHLCAAIQIVDTFANNVPQFSFVSIECTKAKSGEMKEFDIKILQLPK